MAGTEACAEPLIANQVLTSEKISLRAGMGPDKIWGKGERENSGASSVVNRFSKRRIGGRYGLRLESVPGTLLERRTRASERTSHNGNSRKFIWCLLCSLRQSDRRMVFSGLTPSVDSSLHLVAVDGLQALRVGTTKRRYKARLSHTRGSGWLIAVFDGIDPPSHRGD